MPFRDWTTGCLVLWGAWMAMPAHAEPAPPPPPVAPPPRVAPTPPGRPGAVTPRPPARADQEEPIPDPTSPFTPGTQNSGNAAAWSASDAFRQPMQNADPLRGADLLTVPKQLFTRGGTQGPIKLRSAADVDQPVQYELFCLGNRASYIMASGKSQSFTEDRVWGIRFHRGLVDESLSYRLLEGEYEFVWTEQGWDLVLVKAGPTMSPPPPRRANVTGSTQHNQSDFPPPPSPVLEPVP